MSLRPKKVTLEEIWPRLEAGVEVLINDIETGMSSEAYMQLYTMVYNYCTTTRPQPRVGKGTTGANFVGEELYKKLCAFLEQHMARVLAGAAGLMDENLLRYYSKQWDQFTSAIRYINHIFSYLNRHWIKREAEDGKRPIYEIKLLGLVIWRDHLFNNIKGKLTRALLDQIQRERDGEEVNTKLIQVIIEGYVRLGLSRERPKETTLEVYKQDFEAAFLSATEQYYQQECAVWIAENTVWDYLRQAEKRFHQEKDRSKAYLHPTTEEHLMAVCERVLLEKHLDAMHGEFHSFLANDKVEDLGRMYRLLSKVAHALDPLKTMFEKHVQRVGLAEVENLCSTVKGEKLRPQQYVEAIFRVWNKYAEMVKVSFKNDSGFVASLDKACRRFINENALTLAAAQGKDEANSVSKSPELLARYCDKLLRKGEKSGGGAEIEAILTDIMIVFKYIEEKDVFLTFYSKMLAKRLINGSSASEDLESSMISKLKATCGYEYTSKLQRMFTDIGLSKDLTERFKESDEWSAIDTKLEFSILVLATGSWPLPTPSTEFTMPTALQACSTAFDAFYNDQHSGRKLLWLPHLSKGELRTSYLAKPFTLIASTYQIGVLLQFESGATATATEKAPTLSYHQLSIATQLKESQLVATLWALVKTRVLKMTPAPASSSKIEITPDSTYVLNPKFKSKRLKVNINIPSKGSKKRETTQASKEIQEDRKLAIQACIVRIMKSRKELPHAQLISEVVTQLRSRFKPRIPLIKKSIDILIDKDYLERAQDRKDLYQYIA